MSMGTIFASGTDRLIFTILSDYDRINGIVTIQILHVTIFDIVDDRLTALIA